MTTPCRILRAAGACLAICPLVLSGGERGGNASGRGTSKHNHNRSRAAWVTLPSGTIPTRKHAVLRATSSGFPRARQRLRLPGTRGSCRRPAGEAPLSMRLALSPELRCSKHRSSQGEAHTRRKLAVSPTWLPGGRLACCRRGRFSGRLQLDSVAAARSPGDGTSSPVATTSAGVSGAQELREAFEAAGGDDGLLGLDGFQVFPAVRELLDEGLLQESEVVAIWEAVPKADATETRVDFIGFTEAFARVDALFEDEGEEDSQGSSSGGDVSAPEAGEAEASFRELVGSAEGLLDLPGLLSWSDVTELFDEGLLTQDEVEQMWEGLPKVEDSVTAAGTPGGARGTLIDLQGFLEFDRKLSNLFEDEEEDEEVLPPAEGDRTSSQGGSVAAAEALPVPPAPPSSTETEATTVGVPSVTDGPAAAGMEKEQRPLEEQFSALAGSEGGLLSLEGLLGWNEVVELLDEDLLAPKEVEEMFQALPKAGPDGSAIDVDGFLLFATKLDSMFEEVSDEAEDAVDNVSRHPPAGDEMTASAVADKGLSDSSIPVEGSAASAPAGRTLTQPAPPAAAKAEAEAATAEAKGRLLALAKGEARDCGMGCGEVKRARILEAMEALVAFEEGNLVSGGGGPGPELVSALEGEWRLLYTSSNAMEYNQGLTGLANTIPNAKFRGLRQILHADGMVFDAEYEEELSVRDEAEPLIVTVTSDWEVKQTSSLITGKSSVAVSVSPKQIKYGFITVRSERWKTLRAMMLLDIAYLDSDLRIMRGQTARQNFFVFTRV